MAEETDYKMVTFTPDTIIFSEGEKGNAAYLVLSGEVHLSVLNKSTHKVIMGGTKTNLFGEMALFNRDTRLATAVAKTQVECAEITEDHIQKQLKKTPFLVRALFHALMETVQKIAAERGGAVALPVEPTEGPPPGA